MDIQELIEKYQSLHLEEVIDHEQFNLISIDHHSTRIEGSTLTEVEAQVLINEGRTPKGKPLDDSLMVKDHHEALLFTIQAIKSGMSITKRFIQQINGLVMKSTGKTYNTVFGTIDSTTGAFRKGNVSAGNTYFPNYDKVDDLTTKLVSYIKEGMSRSLSVKEQLDLSFDAHYHLVAIHPFYDGNGRTSRLLMNAIQTYYGLPLAIVCSENKAEYIEAIIKTKETEDLGHFREFMQAGYTNLLSSEISKYQQMQKPSKGRGFTFLF